MAASNIFGCLRVEKIIFFSQGRPFRRTSAALRLSAILSKLTLVGQFVMQDLQTRQLKTISETSGSSSASSPFRTASAMAIFERVTAVSLLSTPYTGHTAMQL